MRIFMTGATGVVGRRALPVLLRDHTVTVGIRDEGARERLVALGAQCTVVDLFDFASLRRAMDGHDTVINLATHIPSSAWKMMFRRSWSENDRIRSAGVRNLVDAARDCGVTRYIQESFAPVYPDRGDAWIDETTRLEPTSYNRTVLDAEASTTSFTDAGRTGVILRFAGFYGRDAMQVEMLVRGVKRGWALLPGAPEAFISSVSHDDAATAVVAALSARAGAYNIADDEPVTRAAYFGSLASALGAPPPRFIPGWMSVLFGSLGELMSRSERISNRKFRDETGWHPRFPSVREGWAAMFGPPPTPPARETAREADRVRG